MSAAGAIRESAAVAALSSADVDSAVAQAVASARAAGIRGASLTPHLLAAVERATGGRSIAADLALLEANARLAGELAVALAADRAATE